MTQAATGAVTAQWIVCEQTGRWVAAIRGALAGCDRGLSGGVLRETRQLDECDQMLVRWPASLVAVEVAPANFPVRVRWLAELEARFPLARAVVFSRLAQSDADWAMRAAGALEVIGSSRGLPEIVALAERHFAGAPRPALGITQQILAGLPWGS